MSDISDSDFVATREELLQRLASLRAEVATLKEQNALLTVQVQRHQWQPIETAPRDGTPVDLWHKSGGRIPETWWDEEDQCWSCVMDDDCFSHWMPMPEVPGISALPQQVKSEDASSPKPSLTERRTNEQNRV